MAPLKAPGLPWRLGVLWLILIAAQLLWLGLDRRPFAWDESVHYMGAVGYYRTFQRGGPEAVKSALYQSDFYPPLHEALIGAIFLATGPSPKTAAALNLLYLALSTWLLWLLGRRLFAADVGATAAFLLAASSAVVIQSKFLMLDIPLLFWVLLGVYCYVRSEGFAQRAWALAYGLAFGAALLTKWSALFFLALPPLWAALTAVCTRSPSAGRVWLNAVMAYALAALLAGPWYAVHLLQMLRQVKSVTVHYGEVEGDPVLSSPAAWFYYLGAFFRQMSWPLALLALAGLVPLIWRRRHLALWALWLGAPYLLLTLIRNKDPRYTLPLLPWMCLAATAWTQELPETGRRWLHAALSVLAVLQLLYVSFGAYAGPVQAWLSRPLGGVSFIETHVPERALWPVGRILDDVRRAADHWPRRPVLRVIPDHASFARVTFIVEQSRRSEPEVLLAGCTDWPAFTDFAVTKTGSLALPFLVERPRRVSQELAGGQSDPDGRFELLRRYPLPDGSEALLYLRRDVKDPGPPAKILDELHLHLTSLLARYVRDAKGLSLEIIPISSEQTLEGRFQAIRIRAASARVGDFAHKPLGVVLRNLDIEFSGPVLDLSQARREKLVPYELEELALNHLEVEAAALNRALADAGGEASRMRVNFTPGVLGVAWTGRPAARLEAALSIVPDQKGDGSENLRFDLLSLRVWGLPLPAKLVQPLLEDFNPLFKLAGLPSRVRFGSLKLENGSLELGLKVEKKHRSRPAALVLRRRAGYN